MAQSGAAAPSQAGLATQASGSRVANWEVCIGDAVAYRPTSLPPVISRHTLRRDFALRWLRPLRSWYTIRDDEEANRATSAPPVVSGGRIRALRWPFLRTNLEEYARHVRRGRALEPYNLELWELERCNCPEPRVPMDRILAGEAQLRCLGCLRPFNRDLVQMEGVGNSSTTPTDTEYYEHTQPMSDIAVDDKPTTPRVVGPSTPPSELPDLLQMEGVGN